MPYRKQLELKGTMIDCPKPMRSLLLRSIPADATIASICEAMPKVHESMLECHEIREDERGCVELRLQRLFEQS